MKKNIVNNCSLINTLLLVLSVSILFFVSSCRSTDTESLSLAGPALISVSIKGGAFENGEPRGNASASAKTIKAAAVSNNNTPPVQETRVAFNKDFDLVAQLTPVSSARTVKASSGPQLAAIEQEDVLNAIRYKVVVYAEDGTYVTERDYVRGQESSAPDLKLNGGSRYTFIVYSLNRTDINAIVDFSNPANKTLATSSLQNVTINNSYDVMYFRQDMVVSGNSTNNLNVVFKHLTTQITTTIDASAIGSNVVAISGGFSPAYQTADVNLSDAAITRADSQLATVSFTDLNKPIVQSLPTLINSDTEGQSTGSFVLSTITVGSDTRNDLSLPGLTFTPGVKYNLKITLRKVTEGDDEFIIDGGVYAARINGIVWTLKDLSNSVNFLEYRTPTTPETVSKGSYYQFGILEDVGEWNASQANGKFNPNNNAGPFAWNTGTEATPKATLNDPCRRNGTLHNSYRMPTATELENLIAATTASNFGSFYPDEAGDIQKYNVAKILTSKKNPDVKMYFPVLGFAEDKLATGRPPFYITARGYMAGYLTSSMNADRINTKLLFIFENSVVMGAYGRSTGFSVRCVRDANGNN